MNILANEVLHNIFIQLELEERIECTLVCHKWWRVLDNYSLVHDIKINQNQDGFSRFLEMIKQCPHRAS
jgi:hypothetical protein